MHPAARVRFVIFVATLAVSSTLLTTLTRIPLATASPSIATLASLSSSSTFASFQRLSLAPLAPTRIQLRGIARIDAHVARSHGKLVVSGTISDDTGGAIRGTRVAVQIGNVSASAQAGTAGALIPDGSFLPLASSAPEMCTDVAQAPVLEGADRMLVPTATSTLASTLGTRFCVRLAVPTGRYVAHLEVRGAGLVDGSRLDLPIDLALEPVTLRFDPEPTTGRLDWPHSLHSLDDDASIDVTATTEDDGVTTPAAGLPLALSNEAGGSVASATTDATGRAHFVVPGTALGRVGMGELRVSFEGSTKAGATSHAAPIERSTHVRLELPDATGGRLPIGSPDSGLSLRVVATAACAARRCDATPTGTVEVRLGAEDARGDDDSRVVGAATLHAGEARVVVTFASPADESAEVPLRIRYVADAPWFLPPDSLVVTQPVSPPSPWNRVGFAAAGLLVIAWLGAGRFSRALQPTGPAGEAGKRKAGVRLSKERPAVGVEVLKASDGAASWTGRVIDAHEGSALEGVRVAVERPGFDRTSILAETLTDAGGAFVLAAVDPKPGDQLVAHARLHEPLRIPMPPIGEVLVRLGSRRRALLERFVDWARGRGRPFDASPEPTPGHVRRVARAIEEVEPPAPAVAAAASGALRDWADAVEQAAYGGETVDAAREAEVDRLAPHDAARAPDSRPR